RLIRTLGYIRARSDEDHTVVPNSHLDQVNILEPLMRALSDEALKDLTPQFRACLAGEFEPRQYLKRPTQTTEPAPSADGEEGDEGDPLEPEYTLELLRPGQESPQLAAGEEVVSDPLGLAAVRAPAGLDDLLPYAFAACREAARRSKNMR